MKGNGNGTAMPHAPESEATVLGLMMVDPDAATAGVELLDAEDFFREPHRQTYRAMIRLFRRGELLGWQSIADELLAMGQLQAVGGKDYLARIHDGVSLAADIGSHASRVLDTSQRRRLLQALQESIGDVTSDAETTEVFDRVEHRVFSVAERGQRGGPVRVGKGLGEVFADMEERSRSGNGTTGVPTGLADLDELTGGLQKQDLAILAARPSMGKTALALQIALGEALRPDGGSVLLFSMEMSKKQVQQRLLSTEALVDLGRIVRGRLQDDDIVRLGQAAGHVNAARLLVDESPSLSPLELRARARKIRSQEPDLSLVVVDYLQLMSGGAGHENRQQEVSEISRALKATAKDLDVPVLALSQLSRAPEQRSDHRPNLSDLRESGALEQDADLVMFLYRPEYYLSAAKAADEGVAGDAEIIIAKQRNGPTDTVLTYFRKESTRFENAAKWGNQ